MEHPLVSISCITYNHEPFIRQCLDGFFMQEGVNFEILIHDDASTDGTQDVIREYMERYPGVIKPIFQTKNQWSKGTRGMMATFNFPRANGKYIAMCEGDDYWTDPLKLQKQVDFLEQNPDFVMCFTNCSVLKQDTGEVIKERLRFKETIFDQNQIPKMAPTLTRLMRADLLRDMPQKKIVNGDTYLMIYLLQFGKIKYLDFISGTYRIHKGGIWSHGAEVEKYVNSIDTYLQCFDIASSELKLIMTEAIFRRLLKLSFLDKNLTFKKIKEFKGVLDVYKSSFNRASKRQIQTVLLIVYLNSYLKSSKINNLGKNQAKKLLYREV